jgi:hypothetical protein
MFVILKALSGKSDPVSAIENIYYSFTIFSVCVAPLAEPVRMK